MTTIRKKHSAQFKFKVALEAAKEIKTLNELSSQFSVHQGQISQWKKQFLESGPSVFGKDNKPSKNDKRLLENLYEQIGKLTVEVDWLKKKLST